MLPLQGLVRDWLFFQNQTGLTFAEKTESYCSRFGDSCINFDYICIVMN